MLCNENPLTSPKCAEIYRVWPKFIVFGRILSCLRRTSPNFFYFKTCLGAALGPAAGDQLAPRPNFCAGSPPGGDFRRPLGGQRLEMLLGHVQWYTILGVSCKINDEMEERELIKNSLLLEQLQRADSNGRCFCPLFVHLGRPGGHERPLPRLGRRVRPTLARTHFDDATKMIACILKKEKQH